MSNLFALSILTFPIFGIYRGLKLNLVKKFYDIHLGKTVSVSK